MLSRAIRILKKFLILVYASHSFQFFCNDMFFIFISKKN